MNLAPKALKDLTDEFIKKFFELAHSENKREKKESSMPQLVSDVRNDSFQFNYMLPECIANSEFVKKENNGNDYVLIGHGFASNVLKKFFTRNIKGINKDLLFIIKNHKNQDDDLDFFIRNVKTSSEDVIEDVVNGEYFSDKTKPLYVKATIKKITHSFVIHNTKSGYKGSCVVTLKNDKLKDVSIFGLSSNVDLQLTINSREEPEIHHFKHVADINSFFVVVNQVKSGIKDMIKENKTQADEK